MNQAVTPNVTDAETTDVVLSANATHIVYTAFLPKTLQLSLTKRKQAAALKAVLRPHENVKVIKDKVGNCPEEI